MCYIQDMMTIENSALIQSFSWATFTCTIHNNMWAKRKKLFRVPSNTLSYTHENSHLCSTTLLKITSYI